MIDSLFEIREWAKGLLNDLENSPIDTFHVRITENRKRWHLGFSNIARVKEFNFPLVQVNKAVNLFEELYNYFNKGYKAPHGIDELPGLCKEALNELLIALDKLEVQTRGVR